MVALKITVPSAAEADAAVAVSETEKEQSDERARTAALRVIVGTATGEPGTQAGEGSGGGGGGLLTTLERALSPSPRSGGGGSGSASTLLGKLFRRRSSPCGEDLASPVSGPAATSSALPPPVVSPSNATEWLQVRAEHPPLTTPHVDTTHGHHHRAVGICKPAPSAAPGRLSSPCARVPFCACRALGLVAAVWARRPRSPRQRPCPTRHRLERPSPHR